MDAGTRTSPALPSPVATPAPRALVGPTGRRTGRVRTPRRVVVLLVALGVLNLADLVTTRLVLERGGAEGNPVMRPLVDGFWPAASSKVLCVALIAALAVRCRPRWTTRLLAPVTLWYALVVVWNLVVLGRLG